MLLALYASLVIFGWLNIHAVSYEQGLQQGVFDLSRSAGRQLIFILSSGLIFVLSLFIEAKLYQSLAYVLYCLSLLLLVSTLFFGVGGGGHSAWLQWGSVQCQPAELAKLTCALTLAKYLEEHNARLTHLKTLFMAGSLVLLPAALVLLQGDVGSSLVFSAFIIMFYREGLPHWVIALGLFTVAIAMLTLLIPRGYLIIGTLSIALLVVGIGKKTPQRLILVAIVVFSTLALVEGSHFLIKHVLKPHQQNRIRALVDPTVDPLGIGWNVTQSKIAIGSGGFWGKGFLQGTQTKYGFVPEQRTDFIFCTVGEEHGWLGASLFIVLFMALVFRVLHLAERQRLRFARVYGYAVAAILFFHFMINIGMTIGLMPVIGIPLPFISYGGSSMWSFSMMLFILLKFDAERKNFPFRQAMAVD